MSVEDILELIAVKDRTIAGLEARLASLGDAAKLAPAAHDSTAALLAKSAAFPAAFDATLAKLDSISAQVEALAVRWAAC